MDDELQCLPLDFSLLLVFDDHHERSSQVNSAFCLLCPLICILLLFYILLLNTCVEEVSKRRGHFKNEKMSVTRKLMDSGFIVILNMELRNHERNFYMFYDKNIGEDK